MNVTTAVLASLASAAVFAVATVLQARSAASSPQAQGVRPAEVAAFLRTTLSHPSYLTGLVAAALGLALHAVALHAGSLALVQPLIVTTVLFTLPLHHRATGTRLTRAEVGWAVLLSLGLAGFLLAAHSPVAQGRTSEDPVGQVDSEPAAAAVLIALAASVVCVVLARRQAGAGGATARGGLTSASSATLLGLAAGIAFAVTAVLLKASTEALVRGPVALLTSPALYALVVVGGVGLVLRQLALSAGPLTASLPAFTVIDPLVSVALGVAVFNEQLRSTPLALLVQAVCLALLAAGAIGLTRGGGAGRRQSRSGDRHHGPGGSQRGRAADLTV